MFISPSLPVFYSRSGYSLQYIVDLDTIIKRINVNIRAEVAEGKFPCEYKYLSAGMSRG
jgi:hypothetical protein